VLLNYLLALLSGLLLVVVHPRWNLPLLAPFAVGPLIYALLREWEPKHRFLLGYVTGLVFWAGINYWIHFVISVHGNLGSGLGAVGFVLFVLLRAIPLGLFGLLAGVLVQRPYAIAGVACLWVGIERMPWLFNYTWLHLGNAGIDMGVPMRLAPVTGARSSGRGCSLPPRSTATAMADTDCLAGRAAASAGAGAPDTLRGVGTARYRGAGRLDGEAGTRHTGAHGAAVAAVGTECRPAESAADPVA
jgi:hypothetical protein